MKKFFSAIDIPKLSENQAKLCEEVLTKNNSCNSLKNIQNDNSPGNHVFLK